MFKRRFPDVFRYWMVEVSIDEISSDSRANIHIKMADTNASATTAETNVRPRHALSNISSSSLLLVSRVVKALDD